MCYSHMYIYICLDPDEWELGILFDPTRNKFTVAKAGAEGQRRAMAVGVQTKTVCKGISSDTEVGVSNQDSLQANEQ